MLNSHEIPDLFSIQFCMIIPVYMRSYGKIHQTHKITDIKIIHNFEVNGAIIFC